MENSFDRERSFLVSDGELSAAMADSNDSVFVDMETIYLDRKVVAFLRREGSTGIIRGERFADYVLSKAVVARSFMAYLCTTVGFLTMEKWWVTVYVITVIIYYSMRESLVLNVVLTALHIVFLVFLKVVGLYRGEWKNFTRPADPVHPGGFFHSVFRWAN